MNSGIDLHFVHQSLDTSNPHFRDLLACVSQPDEVYLKCYGERISQGMIRSKTERARKPAAETATVSAQ
jgi:hypothetical protein